VNVILSQFVQRGPTFSSYLHLAVLLLITEVFMPWPSASGQVLAIKLKPQLKKGDSGAVEEAGVFDGFHAARTSFWRNGHKLRSNAVARPSVVRNRFPDAYKRNRMSKNEAASRFRFIAAAAR